MPATEKFTGSDISQPPSYAAAVTPDDANEMAAISRAIYVGSGGSLKVRMAGGMDITFIGVQSGTLLPVRAVQVYQTGTTATAIVSLY